MRFARAHDHPSTDRAGTPPPGPLITADLDALDSAAPDEEIRSLARAADRSIAAHGLAVVATPRTLSARHSGLASNRRIADRLARVLHEMTRLPRTVVAKGGITSAVVARVGLGAATA
ncbi:nucleotide-binding domain containing protein [Acrocarpospora catenulata]|uniref:nucleotide-binding domain containing protein n=1 Tax=Acrocarpospora catenulata TaxID=2836182 RepID=UPI001BDA683C|nr:nucleotide-binding domain containing protein [Acrocarpospora catenulata]